MQQYTNIAFISYKREDEKWAKWLQNKLEHYQLPIEIRKQKVEFAERPRHVFKDTTDLSGGVLEKAIKEGLASSKFLIVICSPRAAKSPWVCKEVQEFIDSGREEYIIPFIIDGEPYSKDIDNECFPEALKSLAGEKELLGININENGRDSAAVKVIARMFNVRFDTLWQRFQKREKKRRRLVIGVLVISILLIAGVALFIGWQNIEIRNKNQVIMLNEEKLVVEKASTLFVNGNICDAVALCLDFSEFYDDQYFPEIDSLLRASYRKFEENTFKLAKSVSMQDLNTISSNNGRTIFYPNGTNKIWIQKLLPGEGGYNDFLEDMIPKSLYIHNIEDGTKISEKFDCTSQFVLDEHTKKLICVNDLSKNVEYWDTNTWTKTKEVSFNKYLHLSADGTRGVTYKENDKGFEVYDCTTGEKVFDYDCKNEIEAGSICINYNGTRVAFISNGKIVLIDEDKKENLFSDDDYAEGCCYDNSGRYLLIDTHYNNVRLFRDDIAMDFTTSLANEAYSNGAHLGVTSKDGEYILINDEIYNLKIHHPNRFVNKLDKRISSAYFSGDNNKLIVLDDLGNLHTYVKTPEIITRPNIINIEPLINYDSFCYPEVIAYKNDGTSFLTWTHEGDSLFVERSLSKSLDTIGTYSKLPLWYCENGELTPNSRYGFSTFYNSSHSLSLKVTNDSLMQIRKNGKLIVNRQLAAKIKFASFSPDDRYVVITTGDYEPYRIYDVESGVMVDEINPELCDFGVAAFDEKMNIRYLYHDDMNLYQHQIRTVGYLPYNKLIEFMRLLLKNLQNIDAR